MEININGKKVELKKTIRSLIFFEDLTGHSFNPTGIADVVKFLYSVVMSSDKNLNITLDEFIDWLDENPEKIEEFSQWLAKSYEVESQFGKAKKKGSK